MKETILVQEITNFFTNHFILIFIWIILFSVLIFLFIRNWIYRIKIITCDETITLINKNKAVIIDIRNKYDYMSGHIINSLNLPYNSLKNDNFKKINKIIKKPIIIICTRGNPNLKLIKMFYKIGFKQIFILKDGIMGWNKENLPLIKN